jgi:hypothetical protein
MPWERPPPAENIVLFTYVRVAGGVVPMLEEPSQPTNRKTGKRQQRESREKSGFIETGSVDTGLVASSR